MHSRPVSLLRVVAAFLLVPAAASASFHLVKVVEVFPGTAAQPNAQYVVLQAYAASQNFVLNHSVVVFDASGAPAGTFTFSGNVANGANQMKMLIATSEAATLFNVTADLTMTPVISPLGGKVCWDASNVDCVSWGNYTGSTTGVGTPFNVPVGLELGRSALRRLDICMGATTLESCDDTGDSANDFVMGLPAPKNNAGNAGTPPSSACGNSTVEGLETCDDGNSAGGDGCSAACRWEPDKIVPQTLAVDTAGPPGAAAQNGVLEPGESVSVSASWKNLGASQVTLTGTGVLLTGPAGATYTIDDSTGDYGPVDPNATASCLTFPCYSVTVSAPASRPAQHWDATLSEVLSTYSFQNWSLHVGDSFPDVANDNLFYAFIENLFHNGVTGGCAGGNYCPTNPVTRAQMAVFLLKAKNGSGYVPPACTGTVFADVPCTGGPFDPWIEDLAAQGITGGCGGGLYCPDATVTRKQMAVFLLKAKDGSSYDPPDCTGVFEDVPCTPGVGFPDWIEELYNRQITGGCSVSPLNYCPDSPNNRGQMAVFLVKTFGLALYGP